jgi:altronate hydrolase
MRDWNTMKQKDWIELSPQDNVLIVVSDAGIPQGTTLDLPKRPVTLKDSISRGHKAATAPIRKGAPILKFGHVIGLASRDIEAGEHVHTHNVVMPPSDWKPESEEIHEFKHAKNWEDLPNTFKGYLRSNRTAGIRNYVVVVASVNCSATVVKAVCRNFDSQQVREKYGIDGVIPVTHQSGCAQAIGGLGYQVLNRTLAGWIFHPNVVGAVVIGLGCEGTTFKSILETKKKLNLNSEIPIETLNIQDTGGTAQTIRESISRVEKVLSSLPKFQRKDLPVSYLNLALNCGGSDSFSSLTANPALGVASDILVSKGGAVALAEVPECHGAEEMLLNRSVSNSVREKLNQIFSWWQDYAERQKVSLNNNLAPGNIAGGITTIIEKSLGAVAKAGSTPLTQVVDYSEPMTEKGFILMNTPGFDPVSVTGLVAGGSNLVAFTTGRGSVYGCSIAPTIKIATNSALFQKLNEDMDIDAGKALGTSSIEDVATDLYRFIIEVANGEKTCSEALGLGWEEFAPWPIAETL